jgi:hypothetical protein
MADTFTTNLNLTKPEPGAAEDTWGISLNSDLDVIDAIFSSSGTQINLNPNQVNFADNKKAIFGAGSDLQIYHDSATQNSFITESGAGSLKILGTNILVKTADDAEVYIDCNANSSVDLYYDNSKKLATTSTGIDVTGTVVSDGLNVDTGTLSVDSTNNRVGIGNTSPTEKLHVQGTALMASSKLSTNNGTTYWDIRRDSSTGHFVISDDGLGDVVTIKQDSGNIGISTTSPDKLLHLKTSVNNTAVMRIESTAANSYPHLEFKNDARTFGIYGAHGGLSDAFSIYDGTAGAHRLTINTSGRVGIGTTSPDRKLHINESTAATSNFIHMTTAATGASGSNGLLVGIGSAGNAELWNYEAQPIIFATSSSERMRIDSSGNVGIGTTSPSGNLHVVGASGGQGEIYVSDADEGTSGSDSLLITKSGTTSFIYDRDASSQLRLGAADNSGIVVIDGSNQRVGIGLTSPSEKLHVYGTGATISGKVEAGDGNQSSLDLKNSEGEFRLINDGGELYVYDSTDAAERFRIDTSGRVGIGTTSPDMGIHLSSTGTNYLRVTNTTTGVGSDFGTSSTGTEIINRQAAPIRFHTNATERMRIDSSGNVLINRTGTSGLGKLNVEGGADFTGGNVLLCRDSGRVGIGTSSPSQKLHVVGDVLIEEGSGFPRITLKDSDGTNTQGFLDQSGGDLGFTAQNGTSHGRIRFKRYDGTTTETSAIIDTSGNLGIGTTSPSAPLHVVGNSYVQSGTLYTDTISAYSGSSVNINAGSSHFNVTVNGSERARIDSSGNLLVGTTDSTPNGLTVNGAIVALNDGTRYAISLATSTTASATAAAISNTNGLVGSITTSGSATSYNTSSDARLKDVTGEARGLDVINALNPVSYNWKADDKADEGLIAQEVQEIVPNAVSQNEDEYYQMDYSKLVVHLVKGMKEQQEQIEALQSEINLLKGE